MEANIFGSFFIISVFLCQRLSASRDANFGKLHLPKFFDPIKYDLTINSDPSDPYIDHQGDVRITIKCIDNTNEIIVNKRFLDTDKLEVKVRELINNHEEGAVIDVDGDDYDPELERYIIKVKQTLEKEKIYVVTIPFSKKKDIDLADKGYIALTYRVTKGLQSYSKPLGYTKMGPIDARGIFPSLDEISVKTPFRIKLGHPKSVTALSNANSIHQEDIPGKPDWILDVFEDTVAMTTYSVTLAFLKFVSKKTTEPTSEVEIRVWADEALVELIEYVFPVAFHSLKFYFDLFKVPYGFKKLDVIILPNRHIKAWESYGLILLSYEYVKKTFDQTRTEYELASNFSRTISQQWIGYRVTMDWWNHNWLHRGINRFLQTVCLIQAYPEWEFSYSMWDIMDTFVHVQQNENKGAYNQIMTLDEFPKDPLESENVETQEKIHQLIRMTNFILGSKLFRERIRTYVDTFGYTHSSLPQIWEAFGKVPIIKENNDVVESFSVHEVLTTWLSQGGIPLVEVEQDYETKTMTVTQVPFISLQLDEEKAQKVEKQSWIIPVSYTTETKLNFQDTQIRGWVSPKEPFVTHVDDMRIDRWIVLTFKLNVLGHVNYTPKNWEAIQSNLLHPEKYSLFDVATRVRFIHDIFALAEAGILPYTFLFTTMLYLNYEKHNWPLRVAMDEFDVLHSRLLRKSQMRENLEKYVEEILTPYYIKEFISLDLVPFLESDYVDYRRKILIVGESCKYKVKRCADQARQLENEWKIEILATKPRELRRIILCEAIKYDNTRKFFRNIDILWKEYRSVKGKPNDWAEDIVDALGCSHSENAIRSSLDSSLYEDSLYKGDRFRIFKSLSNNALAYREMKTFFMENYEKIVELCSNDGTISPLSYLKILIEMTSSSDEIQELVKFANSVNLDWLAREIEETIMNAKRKFLWLSAFKQFTNENKEILK